MGGTTLLNVCVYHFSALVAIPVYQAWVLIVQSLLGAVLFAEYRFYNAQNIIGTLVGAGLNFLGLWCLGRIQSEEGGEGDGDHQQSGRVRDGRGGVVDGQEGRAEV